MAIYMEYDGIKGDVTAAGHEKWIECTSLHWGVGRGITSPQVGGSADREGTSPSVSEITLTKVSDCASSNLLREALWGEGKKVTLHLCKTDTKDNFQVYQEYILTNVMISGFSMSSGGDRPTESLSLNFTKIESNFTPMGEANAEKSTDRAKYDLATGKGS
jgi:type VI secretion system secreted protein Hcp